MIRLLLGLLLVFSGCVSMHQHNEARPEGTDSFNGFSGAESPRGQLDFKRLAANPLPPEKAAETVSEIGKNWFYGHGFGETMVAVGIIAAFPPYAIYALGNAALEYSGVQPLYVTNLLPARERYVWRNTFDTLVSGPGRLAASANGEQFRDRREVKVRTGRLVDEVTAEVESQ